MPAWCENAYNNSVPMPENAAKYALQLLIGKVEKCLQPL
jgi:hypothetical protein